MSRSTLVSIQLSTHVSFNHGIKSTIKSAIILIVIDCKIVGEENVLSYCALINKAR